MKKKFFAVALATTMTLSTAMTAMATETKIDKTTLAADSYTEQTNPLQGKNASKVTISYTINWDAAAPKNGWDGVFSFYDAASNGRVSFQTAPYLCFNAGADEKWIDLKADAWCSSNCEAGKDYTFTYEITADAITVSCDGTAIAEFKEVGRGTGAATSGFQEVLDALNTYPTLTLGVGTAKSSFWNTEPCSISITINDGMGGNDADKPAAGNDADKPAAGNDADKPAAGNSADKPAAGNSADKPAAGKDTPKTGDVAPIAALGAVAVIACAGVVVSRKKVTE